MENRLNLVSTTDQINFLSEKDPTLAVLIKRLGKINYTNTKDVFEDLVSCILDMRIHYAPSTSSFRYPRLKRILNGQPISPELILGCPEEILAELKLSHQKFHSLNLLAGRWIQQKMSGINWSLLSLEEIHDKLEGIKGVGSWTIQMILIFTLERPDIFPLTDYQLSKSMKEVYGLSENCLSKEMVKISNQWKPYRSLAVRYLWKYREKIKR